MEFPIRYSKTNNKDLKFNDPNQESKQIVYLDDNILYGYAMSNFLPASRFKWIHPKEFHLNRYTSNSSKRCLLKLILSIQKIYENYTVNRKIIRKILYEHQLKIADLSNIPIGNIKKLVPRKSKRLFKMSIKTKLYVTRNI